MWVFKHIYTESKGLVNAKVRAVIVMTLCNQLAHTMSYVVHVYRYELPCNSNYTYKIKVRLTKMMILEQVISSLMLKELYRYPNYYIAEI